MEVGSMKLDVVVNGRAAELQLNPDHFKYQVVGQVPDLSPLERAYSIEPSGPGIFSILIEGRSYQATILAPGVIQVNDRIFDVEIFDPRELRARSSANASHGRQNIAAPMPGKVVRLLVSVGDQVEPGQGLIVVEAMKMQNEMKSPKTGTVVEVKTKDGATVAAGEILIVIE
jgi:biotin carboxyl carrier protein